MFCPKCGYQNAEGAAFCQKCGTQLSPVSSAQPYPQPIAGSAPQRNGASVRNVPAGIAVLEKVCTGPLILVAVIAFTAATVFNLISSISSASGSLDYFYQMAAMMGMARSFGNLYYASQGAITFLAVIGSLPNILIVAGLWIAYASVANKQYAGMKTSGLTLIKVILIINLVCICIFFAAVEVVLLAAIVNLANSYYGSSVVGPLVGVMIGIAIALVLLILYYVKAVKTINTIKFTAQSGNPSDAVSIYVAVMAFIAGGFALLSIVADHSILSIFARVCSTTAFICFGAFLFVYRNQMRAVKRGVVYNPTPRQTIPATPKPVYAPQTETSSNAQNVVTPQNRASDPSPAEHNQWPQQLVVTCSNCGGQYGTVPGQVCKCPFCGHQEGK